MSLINDILGKNVSTNISGSYTILDNIYSYNAIWLQDAQRIFNIPSLSSFIGTNIFDSVPLPLIGFAFKMVGEVDLLAYEWAKYPYLSKQIITNAGIKQATKFAVDVHSVLGPLNPVALNVIKLTVMLSILDKYIANGGLFTVLTMYGTLSDCVLEKISGISDEGPDGTRLRFHFSRPNISTITSVTKSTNQFVSSLMSGAAPSVNLSLF